MSCCPAQEQPVQQLWASPTTTLTWWCKGLPGAASPSRHLGKAGSRSTQGCALDQLVILPLAIRLTLPASTAWALAAALPWALMAAVIVAGLFSAATGAEWAPCPRLKSRKIWSPLKPVLLYHIQVGPKRKKKRHLLVPLFKQLFWCLIDSELRKSVTQRCGEISNQRAALDI